MNLIKFFTLILLFTHLDVSAQVGLPKIPYAVIGDQEISWSEKERISYFLPDEYNLDLLSDFDQSDFTTKNRERKYRFKWIDGSFVNFSVLNMTPLQNNSYYSIQPTWMVFQKNGTVDFTDLNGNLIKQGSFEAYTDQHAWEDIDPRLMSPVLEVPANFTFVPNLTLTEISNLYSQGFSILNNYPDRLEVGIDSMKMIIDNGGKTKTIIYGLGNRIKCIETDHYYFDGNFCNKYKTIVQDFYTNYKNMCYMQVTERRYSEFQHVGTPLQPRTKDLGQEISEIDVYPNPNNGEFIVSCHGIIDDLEHAQIDLFDLKGNSISLQIKVMSSDQIKILFPVDLPSASYILRISSGKQVITHKISKI
ncbi:MAG TPA: T9SS type A sorting domain-containing protein [Saprospiraceae bacterium]|nr:T9SS type A sorting domain-containing protein [Saprospiraceae bacterium]HQW55756.1 T9SS type A sorting domain-containing protein [Saprospiraceae bacterium]